MELKQAPNQKTGTSDSMDDLAQKIFDLMSRAPGIKPGFRVVHAKGIVCKGTFAPSKEAAALSGAAHFQGTPVPVTVRFSGGAPDPAAPDNSPDSGPRGFAVRFHLPGNKLTDIVALSHNGFIVSNGEEFLKLQQAAAATDPSKPHPWPVEEFVGARPHALKFVMDIRAVPASYGTEAYFSNNSFALVNEDGKKQVVRYQILPVAGRRDLSEDEAKTKGPDFLVEELKLRLKNKPVEFRLIVQIPNLGDPTNDPSQVWPDDRKTVEAGTISIVSVDANSAALEKEMVYDPTHLTDGIELSDDPLPLLRAKVYSLSAAFRMRK